MGHVEIRSEIPKEQSHRIRRPFSGLSRIPFVRPCRLEGVAGTRYGTLVDLSAAGAYVALEPVPENGEGFVISFPFPGLEAPLTVDSVVTWRNTAQDPQIFDVPPGCGLRFLALSSGDLQRIHALVKGAR